MQKLMGLPYIVAAVLRLETLPCIFEMLVHFWIACEALIRGSLFRRDEPRTEVVRQAPATSSAFAMQLRNR